MTNKQRHARNEAYQLLRIAQRILEESGLVAYAESVEILGNGIEQDAKMMARQEAARRINAA